MHRLQTNAARKSRAILNFYVACEVLHVLQAENVSHTEQQGKSSAPVSSYNPHRDKLPSQHESRTKPMFPPGTICKRLGFTQREEWNEINKYNYTFIHKLCCG